jgi:hypothetical protein
MERQVDVMASISFLHLASAGKKISTEKVVGNIRQYHPNAYYFLGSDAADDLSDIAKQYKLNYNYFDEKLGYPSQPFGYRKEKVLLWLKRFHHAAENCGTSHIMMVEDDVWIKKPITVHDEWEMSCHKISHGNRFPEAVLDMMERFSGVRPKTDFYGGGGGSIYNVKTFLKNYTKITNYINEQWDYIQDNHYPTIGWMDCFMVSYYMFCGKDYTENPYMTDTHHHQKGFDFDKFVEKQPEHIEIINNYKKYYWPENNDVLTFSTV